MSLLRMSLSGGILILAVVVLRTMVLHRLPKRTFLALWAVAAVRLLIPFSLPSPLSVYTLADQWAPAEAVQTVRTPPGLPAGTEAVESPAPSAPLPSAAPEAPAENRTFQPGWRELWLTGALLCGGWFLSAYLRCRREFRTSLPVENAVLTHWLSRRRLLRPVALRQTDRISAPLTYGIVRPVILFPSNTDWTDTVRLEWVLEHELTHIRRLDALSKLVLAAAASVHWFNPLVWCMYVLANRDIELSCDEAVVRRLGVDRRSEYALALIAMEERKSGLGPFASAFSKNAIEERITAIMKMKKRSLAAILAAIMLICGVSAAFATSAAPEAEEDLRNYLTVIPGSDFSAEESQRLFALWIDDYKDMTAASFREKMRGARTDKDMELIERFSLSEAAYQLPAGKNADALAAFNDYFFHVYEPLTADQWQTWSFDGSGANGAEYMYNLTILNADTLKVGEYEQVQRNAEIILRQPVETMADVLEIEKLSTPALQVELGYYSTPSSDDPDALLHAQFSSETAAEWERLLTPYVPFGLTYQFDDPDHDGSGLTMWFNGKEVRSIIDEREGIWITEHTGITTYSPDAIELYVVYTGDTPTGLREATTEEQAAFTESRIQSSAQAGLLDAGEEQREFPNATREDYDSLLTLKTANYEDLTLEEFNQRLLDWANEHPDAWNRINCDVIWDDYAAALTDEEKAFAAHTCRLSGTENGRMIQALHTGQPEQDPNFAANLPILQHVDLNGAAWCDLYYDLSYHISDKSVCTVGERDRCTAAMMQFIDDFWQDTDLDTLLAMSEQDVVDQFNVWASRCGTDHVAFHHVTGDHISYECHDERHIYDEYPQTSDNYSESGHHSGHHSDSHH